MFFKKEKCAFHATLSTRWSHFTYFKVRPFQGFSFKMKWELIKKNSEFCCLCKSMNCLYSLFVKWKWTGTDFAVCTHRNGCWFDSRGLQRGFARTSGPGFLLGSNSESKPGGRFSVGYLTSPEQTNCFKNAVYMSTQWWIAFFQLEMTFRIDFLTATNKWGRRSTASVAECCCTYTGNIKISAAVL